MRGRARECLATRVGIFARARRYALRDDLPKFSPRNRQKRTRGSRDEERLDAGDVTCRAPGVLPGPILVPPEGAPGSGSGGSGGVGPQPQLQTKAGAANADITAPVGTPMFAYTARSLVAGGDFNAIMQVLGDPDQNLYAKSFEPSKGIHTRPRSRALVIERGGKKFALVQADLGGIPYEMVQEVLRRIDGTGIGAQELMISATHTHSSTGPIWPASSSLGYGFLGGDLFDPRIFEITAAGIAESINEANARLEPARLGVGRTNLTGASRNRNFAPFRRNEDVPADEAAARAVSVNPELVAVRADAADGRPISVWTNFAIHQTSYGDSNLLFSGDNAATASRVTDREIARDAEERGVAPPSDRPFVSVYSNSSEGDISPDGGSPNPDGDLLNYVPGAGGHGSANMAGQKLAEGMVRAWRDAGANMSDTLPLAARRTIIAHDATSASDERGTPQTRPVGPHAALGQGGITLDDGECHPAGDDADPAHGRKLPIVTGVQPLAPQLSPISLWRIGPLGIASYPLEITKQMGDRIRTRLRDDSGGELTNVVVAGLTNSYQSYMATPEEYDACFYEGSFTLWGRNQGYRYRNATRPLVGPVVNDTPAPPGIPEPPPTAIGTPNTPSPEATPQAGMAVAQPAGQVKRYGRAVFSWRAGDPAVDAPRSRPFVSLQRRDGGEWKTVGTEEGFNDITVLDGKGTSSKQDDEWVDTWQFAECDPVGTYRFRVTGRAVKSNGGSPEDYEVVSNEFTLQKTDPLAVIDKQVVGDSVRVRVRYPDPGNDALMALPRRVRTGAARLRVNGAEVTARPSSAGLAFVADVPPGTDPANVDVLSVEDGCGNTLP